MQSDTSEAQPPAPTNDGDSYAFVANVGGLRDAISYTLAPGHELRQATTNEVASIDETLEHLAPRMPYQFLLRRPPDAKHDSSLLSKKRERPYFVIGFTGNNQTLVDLSRAFDLTHLELQVGFTAIRIKEAEGRTWDPLRLSQILDDAMHGFLPFVDVSRNDVEEIRKIHSQLIHHDNSQLNLQALAGQIGQLKGFPRTSPLRFLGYFALLESLLTHIPKPSDPYDSITRQVKKKLALLNRRFPRSIDYAPFGGAEADTVWAKMYAYRSQLAHGGNPQFNGEFQALLNYETALALIKETVKAVTRQALTEPQLILDLREC